jgi:hypothetical protein
VIQATSARAYREIAASPILSRMQREVYKALADLGASTAREIGQHTSPGADRDITSRLSELCRMGAVSRMEERRCTVSGRLALVWVVTGEHPIPLKKPKRFNFKLISREGYALAQQFAEAHRIDPGAGGQLALPFSADWISRFEEYIEKHREAMASL